MTVLGEPPALNEIIQKDKEPTVPTLTNQDRQTINWIPWGDADDYPQRLDKKLRKVGVALTAVDVNSNIHYGQGIGWFSKIAGPDGKRILQPVDWPEWDTLAEDLCLPIHLGESIYSLEFMNIGFVEFVLTASKRGLASVQLLDTGSCRFKKRNKNGIIESIYFNSEFGTVNPNKELLVEIPLYDKTKKTYEQPNKFVLPVFYRTLGNNFYPEPNIQALIANGWISNATKIPAYINAIYTNQIALKYHVSIPFMLLLEFAGTNAEKWASLDLKDRLDWKLKLKTWIDDQLTSEANAGKTIITYSLSDNGTEYEIKIEPIESKLESSKELPNAYAANAEIYAAFNLDPELTGFGIPGGKTLSGSGSGKREALLLAQALRHREREVSLQIIRLMKKILQEDPAMNTPANIFPMYIDMDLQTLDVNPTGKQTVVG